MSENNGEYTGTTVVPRAPGVLYDPNPTHAGSVPDSPDPKYYAVDKDQYDRIGRIPDLVVPSIFKTTQIDSQGVGMKYDGGKQLGALVYQDFTKAVKAVNAIGTFGAKKYKRSSWKDVPDSIQRYEDAAHRHLLDYNDGQQFDPESGYHHLAHYAWNVLAVLSLKLETENLHKDDPL